MKSFALIGAVSASIPLFEAPTDLVELTDAPNGQVAWTQCDSTLDVWTLDAEDSSYSPDPFGGGDTLTFDMVGTVSESITVQGAHVTVKWGAITLSDADHPLEGGEQTFDSAVDLSIHFSLPSVAPSGSYTVTIKGYEFADSASTTNMCVQTKFKL
mgnify:CR=1 FL=1|tara:strand:- start:127 stop:594 length:468 start_codon:yes stop_codon:yes gene_type:complete